MKDPFEETIKWLRHVKGVNVRLATAVQEVTRALGLPDSAEEPEILDAISRRPPPEVTLSFSDQIRKLEEERDELRTSI